MGLTKRRDSYYVEFRVLDDGKALRLSHEGVGGRLKRWKVGSLNKTMAKQHESIIKTDLMKGSIKTDQAKPVLFKEWGLRYLELEEVRRLRSFRDRDRILRQHLIPFFGASPLPEIRPDDVEQYRSQRRKQNGDAPTLQTVNNDHIILKHCLNVAIRRGLLVSNPASKVPLPDPHNERDRVLTEGEWERLHEAAAPHLKPMLLVAYHLGQRFGEITNLTWDRVDLQRGFITLRSIDTKTKKARQVPLTPAVRLALIDLAKVRRLNTNHVFLYEGQPIKSIKTAFKRAKRVSGVDGFRFHDLRHCAATNLRRAGVDTATAMKIVGHKSEKMWKRYNAIEEKDLVAAASQLNTYLQSNTLITPANVSASGNSASA
ncbi:MAG TPA: tyrosine-type recombinase/integrase [Nitrospira sp.]|nr:tyrosine-type recombinase/integrase [Nitrospira sp.]